jgi:hypothetical protein
MVLVAGRVCDTTTTASTPCFIPPEAIFQPPMAVPGMGEVRRYCGLVLNVG